MSTYFGYRCDDCDENSPTWLNRGEGLLRDILAWWPSIKPVLACRYIEISVLGVHDDPKPLEFLAAHDGHAVRIRSEYDQNPVDAKAPRLPAAPLR